MQPEYEATFLDINKEEFAETLRSAGATCVEPEHLQRRITLELPPDKRATDTWLRVRDEGSRITLALKSVDGRTIDGQKELQFSIGDFKAAVELLEKLGCEKKSYQESRREVWKLGELEITIDTWPFLEPYVEIEGPSEEAVRKGAKILDLEYEHAIFDTVNEVYRRKYGKSLEDLDGALRKEITFNSENPFNS